MSERNLVLAHAGNLAAATITSSAHAPSAPPANLLDSEPSAPLILIEPAAAWVQVAFGQPVAPRMAAALFCNFTSGAQGRLRGGADAAAITAAPAFDSGWYAAAPEAGLRHRKHRVHDWTWRPAIPACAVWRWDWTDPANPEGALVIGNLVLEPAWQIEAGGMAWDYTPPSLFDPSRKPRTTDGQRRPLRRAAYDVAAWTLEADSEAEMLGAARDLDEAVGVTEAVLVAFDPLATTWRQRKVIWGQMTELRVVTHQRLNLFRRDYEIEELTP